MDEGFVINICLSNKMGKVYIAKKGGNHAQDPLL